MRKERVRGALRRTLKERLRSWESQCSDKFDVAISFNDLYPIRERTSSSLQDYSE